MIIDPNIANETSAAKQRQVVKDAVLKAIEDGSLTYTELLLAPEPLRSHAFEALDGVIVEGTRSMAGHEEPLMQGKVRLVSIAKDGVVQHPVVTKTRIPGTNRETTSKKMHVFGNFADVPDVVPTRIARNILHRDGWPIRQMREGANVIGTVVEWRWLEKEVRSGNALPEYVELYEEIKTRPGFSGEAAAEAPATKDPKRPGHARAGA